MNSAVYDLNKLTRTFVILLGIIVALGVIMVYSSSYIFAKESYGNSAHFFLRQLLFLAVSLSMVFVISKTKFNFWLKYGMGVNIAATLLLAMTFIPSIGPVVKGANRWIRLGSFGIQPGEIIKYTLLLSSLHFFENFEAMTRNRRLFHAGTLLFPLMLLLGQPDFGTFAVSFMVIAFTCFMSSFPRRYFYSGFVIGLVAAVGILFAQPYRVRRLMTFLDPWKNPRGSGFQIIQSYLGFAGGSVWGQGLGNSNEKLFYLPEAHNDFIFSVIGEELGFVGVFCVIALFIGLIFYGFKLALEVKERLGTLLISALVFTMGLQVVLNMGVVLGLLPTKGLNLPFISSGGSSLLANFFAVGLILAVVKSSRDQLEKAFSEPIYGSNYGQSYSSQSAYGSSMQQPTEEATPSQPTSPFSSEQRDLFTNFSQRPLGTRTQDTRPITERLRDPRRLP